MRIWRIVGLLALCPVVAVAQPTLTFEMTGGPQLTIRAKAEQQQWLVIQGKVLVAAVVEGQLVVQECTWFPGPQPEPQPEPKPEPKPMKWQVAVVVETDRLDNLPASQQSLLASLLLREELTQQGHRLVGIFDPDASSTATDNIKPWFLAAQGKELPVLLLSPMEGGPIRVYPLPKDKTTLWQLLESQTPSKPVKPDPTSHDVFSPPLLQGPRSSSRGSCFGFRCR